MLLSDETITQVPEKTHSNNINDKALITPSCIPNLNMSEFVHKDGTVVLNSGKVAAEQT